MFPACVGLSWLVWLLPPVVSPVSSSPAQVYPVFLPSWDVMTWCLLSAPQLIRDTIRWNQVNEQLLPPHRPFWLIYCRIVIILIIISQMDSLFCWAVLNALSLHIFMLWYDYFCLCRQMLKKSIHIHPSRLISSLFHRITALFVVWLLHCRILISLSWCRPSGLSWKQTAALFISLVINITFCSATFPGNNGDNGTSTLSSLFFLSPSHCWSESHFCEQQACEFYLKAIWNFTHFFPTQTSFRLCWIALSLAAGYRTVQPSRKSPRRLRVYLTFVCCFDWAFMNARQRRCCQQSTRCTSTEYYTGINFLPSTRWNE